MRVLYTDNPPSFESDSDKEVLARVVQRRKDAGLELLELDLAILHTPVLTSGYNEFIKGLRTQNSLPPDCRETAFCTVAATTKCWYEWDVHEPIAKEAGVSDAGLKWLRGVGAAAGTTRPDDGSREVLSQGTGRMDLTARQKCVVDYAIAMTNQYRVDDCIFDALRLHFSVKELIELTITIAGFNTVTRFVTALDIGERNKG